jgi:hypothetical protein
VNPTGSAVYYLNTKCDGSISFTERPATTPPRSAARCSSTTNGRTGSVTNVRLPGAST